MTSANTRPTRGREVLAAIVLEQISQDERWGQQNHPDGTGPRYAVKADLERARTERAAANGSLTFRHVLAEEVAEAFAEDDPVRLRAELVQVAAVAATWIEAIDRRTSTYTYTYTITDPWAPSDLPLHPVLVVADEITQYAKTARRAGEEGL
jgi:hypothetical protein